MLISNKRARYWDDKAQKYQGVESGDQDAPFAHGLSFRIQSVYHKTRRRGCTGLPGRAREEERFLTSAGRPLRRSEEIRKNRPAAFEMTAGVRRGRRAGWRALGIGHKVG